jgi:hypothetical protein
VAFALAHLIAYLAREWSEQEAARVFPVVETILWWKLRAVAVVERT